MTAAAKTYGQGAAPGPAATADAASLRLQRAEGAVDLAFTRRGAVTAVTSRGHRGALRIIVPNGEPGAPPDAVVVNVGGGVVGGDRFDLAARWGEGAAAAVTTQAAEKVYRALDATPAAIRTRLDLAAGADAAWIPQETILFDGARLERHVEADVAADARLMILEATIFGRRARGETFTRGALLDRWRIRRDGRLAYADGTRLEGEVAAVLAAPAGAGEGGAVATLLLVAPDAAAHLDKLRELIDAAAVEGGASAWNGLLAVRLVARDAAAMRRLLERLVALLRGRAMPRVWSC